MNSPSVPPFHLNKKDFTELKNELGDDVLVRTIEFAGKSLWCAQNKIGNEFKGSKHIVNVDIILPNETVKVVFYADKFLEDNLPDGYNEVLNSITKTQKAAVDVTVKKCVERFKEKEYKPYGDMIKEAEKIKSLKDSSVLKVIAYKILQNDIWNDQDLTHLCNDKYYKKWA